MTPHSSPVETGKPQPGTPGLQTPATQTSGLATSANDQPRPGSDTNSDTSADTSLPSEPVSCLGDVWPPEHNILELAITNFRKANPQERTFRLQGTQGHALWVKTPSTARLKWLYTATNWLMRALSMPYFQAPPHAGGPGGIASLRIERERLESLARAGIDVPPIIDHGADWLALEDIGRFNLDEHLKALPPEPRVRLWQEAINALARVHARGGYLSQCFARNILLQPLNTAKDNAPGSLSAAEAPGNNTIPANVANSNVANSNAVNSSAPKPATDAAGVYSGDTIPPYRFYFLDLEEDPAAVMSVAQAQLRDWALLLHSTATLIAHDMPACQTHLARLIHSESPDLRTAAPRLFRQLARLRTLKHLQWLGSDAVRLYELGRFAQGMNALIATTPAELAH